MSTHAFPLPPKRRLDIIDTEQLRQKGKRVLVGLCLLFVVTLLYNGWDMLTSVLITPPPPAPEVLDRNIAARRPFPGRRLGRVIQVLREVQQGKPIVRDLLAPRIEDLQQIKNQDPSATGHALLNERLLEILTGLWRAFHSPLWEDRRAFEPALSEVRALFTLLRTDPPEECAIPSLAVGPRAALPPVRPVRDLFQFVTPSGRQEGTEPER